MTQDNNIPEWVSQESVTKIGKIYVGYNGTTYVQIGRGATIAMKPGDNLDLYLPPSMVAPEYRESASE